MADALIQIENLKKRFNSLQVLDGVNLDIMRGQSIVIIGQSGCGKSVLLKHLIRLLDPDEGRVLFDDEDISELSSRQLIEMRRRFGMLFQSAALLDSLTVEENVGLGLKESRMHTEGQIKQIVAQKLEMVGLIGAGHKRSAELSGGMRKRVGLARAIANSPEVLLYDEPTTGLDPIKADMIDDLIVQLNSRLNVTSVAVTHDMKSAFKIADRIVMLHGGKIEFDGSPAEVRATDNEVVQQFISGSSVGPIKM